MPSSGQRTWIGVWLDAPTGKSFHCRLEDGWPNSGSFLRQEIWVSYFSCMPKHGIFVKADKLKLDKRGRDLHSYRSRRTKDSGIRTWKENGIQPIWGLNAQAKVQYRNVKTLCQLPIHSRFVYIFPFRTCSSFINPIVFSLYAGI